MHLRFIILVACFFALTINVKPGHTQSDVVYHVSSGGTDSGDGSLSSPFGDPQKAVDEVVRHYNTNQNPAIHYFIKLEGGTYNLDEGVKIDAAQFTGDDTPRITMEPLDDEKVLISGFKPIDTSLFRIPTDPTTLSRIRPEVQGQIYEADLSDLNIAGLVAPATRAGVVVRFDFVVDGEVQPIARFPNGDGRMQMGPVLHKGTTAAGDGGIFTYKMEHDRHEAWADAIANGKQVWLKGFWRVGWSQYLLEVETIDKSAETIEFISGVNLGIGSKWGGDDGNGIEPYWAENMLEEIDQPGEWSLDFVDQKMYYLPPANISEVDLNITHIDDGLIAVDGMSNFTLKGISITGAKNSALEITGGEDNLVHGCEIYDSTTGITITDGSRHRVVSCDLYELGAKGIDVGGTIDSSLTPMNHEILNNHIHDFATKHTLYQAAVFAHGVGVRVAHNVIHDSPHLAILITGNNHIVEYNEISHWAKVSGDIGAIYSYLAEQFGGFIIRHNYIHHGADGIYFDQHDVNSQVYSNLVTDTYRAYLFKKTRDDHNVRDNIAINSTDGYSVPMDVASGIYERNISINNQTPAKLGFGAAQFANGTLIRSIDDMAFASVANQNYQVAADAPIYNDAPDFSPIDFAKVGFYEDEYREATKHVSYGSDGGLWRVSTDDQVYRSSNLENGWEAVPLPVDGLVQIDALDYERAIGITSDYKIYHFDRTQWHGVPGSLTNVSYGMDGSMWGTYPPHIYRRQIPSGDSERLTLPAGELVQIDALDYDHAVGVTSDNEIYHFDGTQWTQLPGAMQHVSYAKDGSIWGADTSGVTYRLLSLNGTWQRGGTLEPGETYQQIDGFSYGRAIVANHTGPSRLFGEHEFVPTPTGPYATQSSVDFGGVAERAIDGDVNGDFQQGSTTSTANENQPWWTWTLGAEQMINTILIRNRTDCCADRLTNFHVFVSDAPFISDTVAGSQAQPGVTDYHFTGTAGEFAEIIVGRTGRYVRIQLEGSGYLSLAEVQLNQEAPPVPVNPGPSTVPGESPATVPGENPTTVPGGSSTATPGENPTATPGESPTTVPGENPATVTEENPTVAQTDLDLDKDGIPNAIEGDGDQDGDGYSNSQDLDSDNDGIPDILEANGTDVDNNGTVDNFIDINLDGMDDELALLESVPVDTDGDGLANYLDIDSDQDTLSDLFEAGGVDADDNGLVDDNTDANADGWADVYAIAPLPIPDTDDDGIADYLDLDSDDDGRFDIIEAGGTDTDSDGMADGFSDADADGIPDVADVDITNGADSDSDGIDDRYDTSITLNDDINANGIDDTVEADPDGDGRAEPALGNTAMPDEDDDGIPDTIDRKARGAIVTGAGCSVGQKGSAGLDLQLLFILIASVALLYRRRQRSV